MSYKSRFFAVVAAALLVVSLPSAGYAAGQTEEELARQIQAYVPGVGVDDILAGAHAWSAESGQDVRTVLVEALEQARDNQIVQRRSGISERGSGARDTELRKSDYKGDVFYEPVWPAGHVGIFGGNDWIVEAPGVGQVSHWKWVWDKRVLSGTRYFYYHVSQATQDAAADYAYNNLLERPYSINFAVNKGMNPHRLNCSQLVWFAYMKATGTDIDGNGGMGVYPKDLTVGSLPYNYKTIW